MHDAKPDVWADAMAEHAVYLALCQVRKLAEHMELVQGELAGSTDH